MQECCTAAILTDLVMLMRRIMQLSCARVVSICCRRPITVHADDAWNAGTSEEDEEAFLHSFHLDLRQNPEHKALLEGIFAALQRGLGRAAQHAAAWHGLSAIWMADKASAVLQLQVSDPPGRNAMLSVWSTI